MKEGEHSPGIETPPALIDLRNHGQFLQVLEMLKCSLARSLRPSGVALLGVTDGKPTLAACLLPRSMGMAVADDHVVCLECGTKMRRLRRHLAAIHGLAPDAYRPCWDLPRDYPLVCTELSRQIAARARANDLAGQGAQARKPWKNVKSISRRERLNGDTLPSGLLVSKVEELVLEALPVRLSERYLTEKLGIGLRTLRRSFLDQRGATPYVALRLLRVQEAQRRLQAQPDLTLKAVAQQCGFGHYARFRHDLEACFGSGPPARVSTRLNAVASANRPALPEGLSDRFLLPFQPQSS